VARHERDGGAATVEREASRGRISGKTSGRRRRRKPPAIRRFLRDNALSIVAFSVFAICLVGQIVAGRREYNNEQREHQQSPVGIAQYVRGGHFIEATFENWESEFLQIAAFVVLTALLRQKGSPESKKLTGEEEVDEDPRDALRSREKRAKAPWAVLRGGIVLKVYEHSLSLALLLLFVLSFALHAVGGAAHYNEEQVAHGGEALSTLTYIGTSRFWFESFQNWQSEFLSVGALFLLTVWLRERGSPQSKPVAAGHEETGAE
jgi:hypothetical protein